MKKNNPNTGKNAPRVPAPYEKRHAKWLDAAWKDHQKNKYVLGGISRLTFQMSVAALPHAKLMRAIELLGTRVAPLVRKALSKEAMLPAA